MCKMGRVYKVCIVCCLLSIAGTSLLPLEEERLKAIVGGFAVFNCQLDFPFGHKIPYLLEWEKDGENMMSLYKAETTRILYEPKYEGRIKIASNIESDLGFVSINLTDITERDAGYHRCKVSFPNRTPPSRNNGTVFFLEVEGHLIVNPPTSSITVLEGERAEFQCLPKFKDSIVQWYKDGLLISDMPVMALRTVKADNGSLVIPQTVMTDLGEYECRVIAQDGQVQKATAYLNVQYKAKVVYAPKQRYLTFGKSASLDCHFSANPPLTNLRWEKDGFLFDPYNVPGVFYSRNGSLLFNKVDESHEGLYSCTPYNSLGTAGPSPAVRVKVQRPPQFTAKPQSLYLARLGATVTMPCATTVQDDDEPPVIEWMRKDGSELPIDHHYLEGGNLTITEIRAEDRGVYICTASNEASLITAESELLIENIPPRPPYNVTALPGRDSVHLAWVAGHRGSLVEFYIWYRERSASAWKTMKILSRDTTEGTVVGLQPGVEYTMRVLAQDPLGDGMLSKPIFVKTLADEDFQGSGEALFATPVTESSSLLDRLEVTLRLVDEGALARWERGSGDESECTVWARAGDEQILLDTKHTSDSYLLIPSVKEGLTYTVQVECLSGREGSASILVPQYGRLRAVAAGCAIGALLLAALGVALYFGRHHICRWETEKRRR